MSRTVLPSFLLIGAQKAGTTSLHTALELHPQLWFPPRKELNFFSQSARIEPEVVSRFYAPHFTDVPDGRLTGESTTAYLFHPCAAEQIHRLLGPDTRLIAVLRNPLDRAYSHHRMNVRVGWEDRPFATALAEEAEWIDRDETSMMRYSYAARGDYATQLRRYLDLFDRASLQVWILERDVVHDWPRMWRGITHFLGVDDVTPPPLPYLNDRRAGRLPVVDWAWRNPRLQRLRKRLSRRTRQRLRRVATRASADAPLPDRAALFHQYFAEHVSAIERLLDTDLSTWRPRG